MLFNYLNKKINDVQAKDEIAMGCCCEPCTTPPGSCLPTVIIPVTTVVRGNVTAPVGTNVPIFLESEDCLHCVREKCFIQDITVPNPCSNCPDLECQVCVDRFRYIGCINFTLNIPISVRPVFITCFRDSLCIDSVRCYTCSDCSSITCPPGGRFITNATAVIASVTPCCDGFTRITINITLTLTSPCPGCPPTPPRA